MHNPLHIKNGENHIPHNILILLQKKIYIYMVISFFFIFTQETPIWRVPFLSFQLVNSQNSIPRRFPSKKKKKKKITLIGA